MAGKEKDDLTKREVNTWAGCASIVFIGLYLIFSCIVPSPTPTQHEAFRTIASLAAGAFGFLVPGLLMVNFEGTLPWPLPPGKFAISGTSGAAFFLLSYFFSPASPVMEGPRIRVTVFGPTGKLVARPNVESQPLGTVSQDSSGHCVVAIPMMPNLPDTVVTISATDPETLSTGQKDVKLKDAPPIQDVRIDLKKESNGTIEGCVSDSNGIFVAGAQVFVIGYSKEAVKSNEHGEFKLPAHKPNNETVRIHASKKGFEDTDCDVQVGEGGPITVRLMKK